jgi:hypothetical protein
MEATAAGLAILRQFSEVEPKPRVDIALQRLGGWADVGVGVIDVEPVLRDRSPFLPNYL